jgi:hypothetical protein
VAPTRTQGRRSRRASRDHGGFGITLFRRVFIAGFEASTHRRADGRRLDLVEATGHERFAKRDYAQLIEMGILTAREGAAWHRIESTPGRFDFSSATNRVREAEAAGIQVIWDLCHFGWPDDVDPFAVDFPDRLGRYARAFAAFLASESDAVPWYAPVNEISFVAWAGGDVGYLNPFAVGRGGELKWQLVRAALAAGAAVRDVDPRARICHLDPIIYIAPNPDHPDRAEVVKRHNEAQFEAWDAMAGRLRPQLGGDESALDVIGVNIYETNQWVDLAEHLPPGHAQHRPVRELLAAVHRRYGRPLFISETGAEGDARASWLRYICDEVAAARAEGIPVEGICLYPVLDHPGWDDDRHVPVGLWGYPDSAGRRPMYEPLAEEVRRQQDRFALRAIRRRPR